MTRKGAHTATLWAPRIAPFVEAWAGAIDLIVEDLTPHTEASYEQYLRWYIPRTRRFVTYAAVAEVVRVPSVREAYPRHRDQNIIGSVSILKLFNYCS